MQIHYNGDTIPDRYPEWITEQNSIQIDNLFTKSLTLCKFRVSWKVRILRTRTGCQTANTY